VSNTAPANSPQATIQQANVRALEALSDPAMGFVVEAWSMTEFDDLNHRREPILATHPCSNDTDHGKGYCYGPTGDPLCLACQIAWCELDKRANHTISVDVAA
jgi:hypothetical protein